MRKRYHRVSTKMDAKLPSRFESLSTFARPCSQCPKLMGLVELWKQSVQNIARNFLAVQRELIEAEAVAHRLKEVIEDLLKRKVKLEEEFESSRLHSSKASMKRRHKPESTSNVKEEVGDMLKKLSGALTISSNLCKKGALDCFDTKRRRSLYSSSSFSSKIQPLPRSHSFHEDWLTHDSDHSEEGGQSEDPSGSQTAVPDENHAELVGSWSSTHSCPQVFANSNPDLSAKLEFLEEERQKLSSDLEKQRLDNLKMRQSLAETLNNLENQNIQFMLAMQDLQIATTEVKKASALQTKLNEVEKEKGELLEQLQKTEARSSCIQTSLVHLLQEKSNTNLKSEFSRSFEYVTPNVHAMDEDDSEHHRSMAATLAAPTNSDMSVLNDGANNVVLKQGFMVKEGGKVKSWKKRLFVLTSEALDYYKCEEPAGTIHLDDITSVEHCKKRTSLHPNMLKLATSSKGRTYYAASPTYEEMQSWIGIIESIRRHRKASSEDGAAADKRYKISSSLPKSLSNSGLSKNVPAERTASSSSTMPMNIGSRFSGTSHSSTGEDTDSNSVLSSEQ